LCLLASVLHHAVTVDDEQGPLVTIEKDIEG
jgi:hypothetical protein